MLAVRSLLYRVCLHSFSAEDARVSRDCTPVKGQDIPFWTVGLVYDFLLYVCM